MNVFITVEGKLVLRSMPVAEDIGRLIYVNGVENHDPKNE